METIFWISLFFCFYTYAGYPACLWVMRRIRKRGVGKASFQPTVTVVLAACNEETSIARRIDNLLKQDYPANRLEIVVASDGSEDRTAEVARFMGERVQVVEMPERGGKAAALNAAVARACGEVIVFCDARQTFDPDTVRQLAGNFADPSVGCASGELLLHKGEAGGLDVEMGTYWRYEKWIRGAESATGSVVGATGCVYALRRALYRELPVGTLLDDVMVPMQCVLSGYRTVFDGSARAHDVVSQHVSQEWLRKVRTLAGNWQLMALMPVLLDPRRNPCWWRFVSHKVTRLMVPAALVALLVSGLLAPGPFYRVAILGQLFFYAAALAGYLVPATRRLRVVNLSYFFLVMNLAAVAGFWRWATGRSASSWRPAYQR